MLPVLTRPLGSKKDNFIPSLLFFTLYEFNVSASDAVFVGGKPSACTAGPLLTWVALIVLGCPTVLTRSAHDFGGAFVGGSSMFSGVERSVETLRPLTSEIAFVGWWAFG